MLVNWEQFLVSISNFNPIRSSKDLIRYGSLTLLFFLIYKWYSNLIVNTSINNKILTKSRIILACETEPLIWVPSAFPIFLPVRPSFIIDGRELEIRCSFHFAVHIHVAPTGFSSQSILTKKLRRGSYLYCFCIYNYFIKQKFYNNIKN